MLLSSPPDVARPLSADRGPGVVASGRPREGERYRMPVPLHGTSRPGIRPLHERRNRMSDTITLTGLVATPPKHIVTSEGRRVLLVPCRHEVRGPRL